MLGPLVAATALRIWLLATGSVTFNADEAVVALMARHILRGETPAFFYGQSYMGSLDAYLVAGGFALLGESVTTVRVVQSLLFALIMVVTYALALRLADPIGASAAAWLMAVPPVVVSLYTTATLGGYNEVLLLGTLCLLLGHYVAHEHRDRLWMWAT